MSDQSTTRLISDLGRRRRDPALADLTATVRFDVNHDDGPRSYLVAIEQGEVSMPSGERSADCVVAASDQLFHALLSGRANPMAAVLRGDLTVAGDPELLVAVQRLFPGPPSGPASEGSSL